MPSPGQGTLKGSLLLTNWAYAGKSIGMNISVWQANHSYAIGDVVAPTVPSGNFYRVSAVSGIAPYTSGNSEPTWPTTSGNTVVDNVITWVCRSGGVGTCDKLATVMDTGWGSYPTTNSTMYTVYPGVFTGQFIGSPYGITLREMCKGVDNEYAAWTSSWIPLAMIHAHTVTQATTKASILAAITNPTEAAYASVIALADQMATAFMIGFQQEGG